MSGEGVALCFCLLSPTNQQLCRLTAGLVRSYFRKVLAVAHTFTIVFSLPAFNTNNDIGNFKSHSILLCQARGFGRVETSQIPSVQCTTDGNLSCSIESSTSWALGESELPDITKLSHNTTLCTLGNILCKLFFNGQPYKRFIFANGLSGFCR